MEHVIRNVHIKYLILHPTLLIQYVKSKDQSSIMGSIDGVYAVLYVKYVNLLSHLSDNEYQNKNNHGMWSTFIENIIFVVNTRFPFKFLKKLW